MNELVSSRRWGTDSVNGRFVHGRLASVNWLGTPRRSRLRKWTRTSATTKIFKTDHGFIPNLTHDNYPTWRKKVRHVPVAMRAYSIVTGDEFLPEGNGSAVRNLHREWHQKANDTVAQIHLGCKDNLFPWIDDIDDSVEMWKTLQGRLDNTTNQLGRTRIVRKFHALPPLKDEKITQYCWRLIDLWKKLFGSPKAISDETINTHIFTALPKEFKTTINIFEQQLPVPNAQQVMDRLREDAVWTELAQKIRDESTGSAPCSHRGGHGKHGGRGNTEGHGRGNFGRDRRGNKNDDIESSCTHCKMNNHTNESCGMLERLKMGSGDCNRMKSEEVLFFLSGKPGHMSAKCQSRQ